MKVKSVERTQTGADEELGVSCKWGDSNNDECKAIANPPETEDPPETAR